MIMSFFKTLVVLYCLVFTTHGLARSNEYYQAVVVQALSEECKDTCKKTLFEAEIQKSVHELILAIIKELKFKLTQVRFAKDFNLFTEWKSNIFFQPIKTNKG
jgi:hypothetical protein